MSEDSVLFRSTLKKWHIHKAKAGIKSERQQKLTGEDGLIAKWNKHYDVVEQTTEKQS